MSVASPIMRRATGRFFHYCPGCNRLHPLPDSWSFNGDPDKPTFSPSFLQDRGSRQCHYFIRDGQIQFCGDSHHELRGQTVPMPAMPAKYDDFEWNSDGLDRASRKEGEAG